MVEYKKEYSIHKTGKINSAPSNWNTNMFNMTGGTFKGDPTINKIYYTAINTTYYTTN